MRTQTDQISTQQDAKSRHFSRPFAGRSTPIFFPDAEGRAHGSGFTIEMCLMWTAVGGTLSIAVIADTWGPARAYGALLGDADGAIMNGGKKYGRHSPPEKPPTEKLKRYLNPFCQERSKHAKTYHEQRAPGNGIENKF